MKAAIVIVSLLLMAAIFFVLGGVRLFVRTADEAAQFWGIAVWASLLLFILDAVLIAVWFR